MNKSSSKWFHLKNAQNFQETHIGNDVMFVSLMSAIVCFNVLYNKYEKKLIN